MTSPQLGDGGNMKKDILSDVEPEVYFWLNDGTVIKNLKELYEAMKTMDNNTFSHHVNEQKNDFHNWVRDIHKDKRLAGELMKAKTQDEMAECIRRMIEEAVREKPMKKKSVQKSARRVMKHSPKKKAVKEKLEEHKVRIELPSEPEPEQTRIKEQIDKTHMISGTAIALATLVGFVALIKLSNKPQATGAVVADIPPAFNWAVIISAVAIIAAAVFIIKKVEKSK